MKKRYAILMVTDNTVHHYFNTFCQRFNRNFESVEQAMKERFKCTPFYEIKEKITKERFEILKTSSNRGIYLYEILPDGKISILPLSE